MASKEVTNAAKAIYESRNGAGRTPWSQLPWSHKVPYLDDAEAARKSFLAALQEPNEGMIVAADNLPQGYGKTWIWRAMLNASPLGE
ncbi:hypothetical protein [Ochrobactrum sp. S1502_03]|uniref:hypothetical protein n=1 Tax=Ochrobactrum sp. S1502_03 TaxID=3108451 RepID=UPI0037CC52D5